ncbi:MAG: PEP-CTERM sorting domain-containing protein [Rivularia sp. T60_A2020_040]|nr:PEP-CTERM sorting domain-containing protein [Rivularia sp. T60_A2020_040]
MFKKLFAVTALSAIATVSYAASAQAANFTYSSGGYRNANVTNQGSFSESVNQQGYETFDFNGSTTLPGNDRVKYSYDGSGRTQVVTLNNKSEMKWAPAAVVAEDNKSQYLQVFEGKKVVIETAKQGDTFNYFGLHLGSLSDGNVLEFFNAGKAVEFDYLDTKGVQKVATTLTFDLLKTLAPTLGYGNQTNGFFEFFSQGFNDNFDKIVISQSNNKGGFETDNHTFRIAKGKYSQAASVPEPSIALGILAVGGSMFVGKRKQQKSAK